LRSPAGADDRSERGHAGVGYGAAARSLQGRLAAGGDAGHAENLNSLPQSERPTLRRLEFELNRGRSPTIQLETATRNPALDHRHLNQLLADFVLVVHFGFVAFVVGGLAAIWIGAAAGWRWVRNFRFRIAHLGAICFVAAEALLGVMCPLTVWEDALRGRASEAGFIARWIRGVMFYELPPWVFTFAYLLFAAIVALTYWRVPPARRRMRP